jgi:murein DD-endopeptidase MepM/ murein hydrolase activator NlpD
MTGLNGLADGWRRGSGDGLEEGRCPGAFRGTLGSMTLKSSVIWFATAAILHWPCSATADPQPGPILSPPVRPACISSPFGPRVLPQHPFAGTNHYGVDLPAPAGAPVFATASGKVIRVQKKCPGGLEVLVQHDGFMGIYSHLGMLAPAFAQGKRAVAAGEKLGVVGRSGVISGTHLYFEMVLAGKPVDPAPYLQVLLCARETQRNH